MHPRATGARQNGRTETNLKMQVSMDQDSGGRPVLSESHLRRILRGYSAFYNDSRPHMSLRGNSPLGRDVEPPSKGTVIAIPQVGGLHHRYTRAA